LDSPNLGTSQPKLAYSLLACQEPPGAKHHNSVIFFLLHEAQARPQHLDHGLDLVILQNSHDFERAVTIA